MVPAASCAPTVLQLVGMSHQHQSGFEAVVHFEFVEDVGEVGFDGFFTDKNLFPDLIVGQSFRNQSENFHFSLGKRLDAFVRLR